MQIYVYAHIKAIKPSPYEIARSRYYGRRTMSKDIMDNTMSFSHK